MENNLISAAGFLISAMFGILAAVMGWMGSRVVCKQDEIMEKFDTIKDNLNVRINGLEYRLVRVEALMDDE